MDRYPIPNPSVISKIIKQPLPPAPLTAMLHIAEHCNVRCEFCWHHSFLRKEPLRPGKVETHEVIKLVNELAAMGTKDITLSANGEPTIHPGFALIVKTIKDTEMKLKVVTNLTTFKPDVAAALARADHLIVNLGAWDDASYQAIYAPRGQITFKNIVAHIKALTGLRFGPKIKIGYVITKNNFRQISKAIELAHSCKASSMRFKLMDPSDFTVPLILDQNDRQWLAGEIKKILKTPPQIENNLKELAGTLSGPSEFTLPEHGRCFVGWFVVNINENGTVTLCCQNEELVIGDWRKKSLKAIWEGKKAQDFRNSAKTKLDFDHRLWHACRTCYYSNPAHYSRRLNG